MATMTAFVVRPQEDVQAQEACSYIIDRYRHTIDLAASLRLAYSLYQPKTVLAALDRIANRMTNIPLALRAEAAERIITDTIS